MKRAVIAVLALVLLPHVARAQDEPKVGLAMGYPGAIGVLWHVNERVGLRPEFVFSSSTSESTSSDSVFGPRESASPTDSWSVGTGLSALFYLTERGGVRPYISPRVTYSKSSTSVSAATPTTGTFDSWSYGVTGSVGAEYRPVRHFGVFGEIGAGYSGTTTRSLTVETITTTVGISLPAGASATRTTTIDLRSDSHTGAFATRTAVGVILFF